MPFYAIWQAPCSHSGSIHKSDCTIAFLTTNCKLNLTLYATDVFQKIFEILLADPPFTPNFQRWNQLLGDHFSHLLLCGPEQCSSLGHGEKFSYAHGSSSFLVAMLFSSLYKKLCSRRRSCQVNPQSPISFRLGFTLYFSQLFLRFSLSISSRRQTSLML